MLQGFRALPAASDHPRSGEHPEVSIPPMARKTFGFWAALAPRRTATILCGSFREIRLRPRAPTSAAADGGTVPPDTQLLEEPDVLGPLILRPMFRGTGCFMGGGRGSRRNHAAPSCCWFDVDRAFARRRHEGEGVPPGPFPRTLRRARSVRGRVSRIVYGCCFRSKAEVCGYCFICTEELLLQTGI